MNNNYNAQKIGITAQNFQNYGQINFEKSEKKKQNIPCLRATKILKAEKIRLTILWKVLKPEEILLGFAAPAA